MTAKKNTKPKPKKKTATQPIDPSLPLKSAKQESFCQHYVNSNISTKIDSKGEMRVTTVSATTAYEKAGYKGSRASAGASSARLLVNVRVKQRIEWLQQQQATELAKKGIATREELCAILTSIVRAKHSDYLVMDEDGVSFHQINKETMSQAALKKVETRITTSGNGDKITTRQFDKIELSDKIPAIKALADILGLNKSDENDEKTTNAYKEFLDMMLARNADREHTPLTG